jgi:Dehydrogenases with different specificities (related to short-chain alcohol dehydrogenases)
MNMKKTILLAGTKPKSIGRFLGQALHKQGWDVWLYSRHADRVEKNNWHERRCDISNERDAQRLLVEIQRVDVSVFLADANAHGSLEDLSEDVIKDSVASKLTGSVVLSKQLLARQFDGEKVKMIWCAGKVSEKPKDIILYGMINAGLASYVTELNRHYAERVEAYYLPIGVVSSTTLGDEYIAFNPELAKIAETPEQILKRIEKIIADKVPVGMVKNEEGVELV